MTQGSVLEQIIAGVREDLDQRKKQVSLEQIKQQARIADPARDALAALTPTADSAFSVIAEVKRRSPSKGDLAEIPEPAELATAYAAGGAAVISVLTEQRRFGGSLTDFDRVRTRVDTPLLRKDFTVDEYQIYEARAHGADLILLIVAALDDATLRSFLDLTHQLGMNALVETHTPEEIERATALGAKIVGVNVRNLKTLDVDTARYAQLATLLPHGVVTIAESGVDSVAEVRTYATAGADAVLVGEALVKHSQPQASVEEFTRAGHEVRAAAPNVNA